jgi:hypothetical protein
MIRNRAGWRTTVEIALWRHGWACPLALVTAISAAAGYLLLLQPERQLQRAARIEFAREQQSAAAPFKRVDANQEADARLSLNAVQAILPASAATAESVRKIAVLAQAEQIKLAQSDYQQQVNDNIGVTRVQISQPVRATYPQLRRYIEAVLRALPNASLDQVVGRRGKIAQTQVEALLKWSLWYQNLPRSAAATSAGKENMP